MPSHCESWCFPLLDHSPTPHKSRGVHFRSHQQLQHATRVHISTGARPKEAASSHRSYRHRVNNYMQMQ